MEIYLAGTEVALRIPLKDRNGNDIDVQSVKYRVVDHNGFEVVPSVNLTTYTAGTPEAIVTVSAEINQIRATPDPATITSNQIDVYLVREVRSVELLLTLIDGNQMSLTQSYGLEPTDTLIVGVNTFQSFPHAELVAMDIPNKTGWDLASEHEKTAALIEARIRICQLNFWLLNSNINWGQDSLNYVPEGAYQSPYVSNGQNMFIFNGNLALLTPRQFNVLPARFKAALCKAQVTEADSIIAGDPIDQRRQEGLTLDSVGDVKQMFRTSKPLDMPVSKRTLKYLSQFVTFAKRIGRG